MILNCFNSYTIKGNEMIVIAVVIIEKGEIVE